MTRLDKIKSKERFPISEQEYTVGNLLDGMECQILLNTGDGKSFMSKTHYLRCKSLHSLPKFVSNTQRIQLGNGQYVSVLFIIPIVKDIHGIINSRDSCFSFPNRLIPFFPKEQVILKQTEQWFMKIEVPFVDENKGLTIVKMLDNRT